MAGDSRYDHPRQHPAKLVRPSSPSPCVLMLVLRPMNWIELSAWSRAERVLFVERAARTW